MITGALVLGIIGGVFGFLIGLIGFTVGSAFNQVGMQTLSLLLPITGLVGAGIVKSDPQKGGLAMMLSAVAMCAVFGVHFLSLLPAVPLGIAGGLALAGMNELKPKTAE